MMKVTGLRAVLWFLCAASFQSTFAQVSLRGESSSSRLSSNRKLVGVIAGFELMNTITDTKVANLEDGAVIVVGDIAEMNLPSFNILAVLENDGENVQSMTFAYNDEPVHRIEYAPFAFCGHTGADFARCPRLVYGTHTVTATPYSKNDATGDAGEPYTVTFSIVEDGQDVIGVDPPTPSPTGRVNVDPLTLFPTNVVDFDTPTLASTPTSAPEAISDGQVGEILALQLINSKTDKKIMDLSNNTIVDVVDMEEMTTPTFNIIASVSDGANIQSVMFGYGRLKKHRIENGTAPYAFCGTKGVMNYKRCKRLEYGTHTVTATAYEKSGGRGIAGTPYTVTFKIISGLIGDEDLSPPELLELTSLNVTSNGTTTVDVTGGNAVLDMEVTINDDKSGFKSGYIAVYDEDRSIFHASDSFELTTPSLAGEAVVFNTQMVFQQSTPSGTYGLELYLMDAAGNEVDIKSDVLLEQSLPASVVVISDLIDDDIANPFDDDFFPGFNFSLDVELMSFTAISPTILNATTGKESVEFEIVVQSESMSLYGSIYAYYADPFEVDFSSFEAYFDVSTGEQQTVVVLEIPKNTRPGSYALQIRFSGIGPSEVIDTPELEEKNFTAYIEIFNSLFDGQPPVLLDLIALSSTKVNVSTDEATVQMQIIAKDDVSGLSEGLLIVSNNIGNSEPLYINLNFPSSNTGRVALNFSLPFEKYIEQGKYYFQLKLADNARNKASFSPKELAALDFPSFIDVSNVNEDSSAPVLLDFVILSPTPVNVTDGPATVAIKIVARDKGSGLDGGAVDLYGNQGEYIETSFRFPDTGNSTATIVVNMTIPQSFSPGKVSLELRLNDNAGNRNYISSFELRENDFPSSIKIVNLRYDGKPPQLINFTATSPLKVNVTSGPAIVKFKLDVKEQSTLLDLTLSLIDYSTFSVIATVTFSNGNKTLGGIASYDLALTIPQYIKEDKYYLTVSMSDNQGNYNSLFPDELERKKFPSFVTVVNEVEDNFPPGLLEMIAVGPSIVNVTSGSAFAKFELTVQDDLSGLKSASIYFDDFGELGDSYRVSSTGTNETTITFDLAVEFDQSTREGTYRVERLALIDNAYNEISFDSDDLAKLDFPSSIKIVNSNRDFEPPYLVEVVALSPVSVDISLEPSEVIFQVTVQDDVSGFLIGEVALYGGLDGTGELTNISSTFFSPLSPVANTPLTFNVTLPIQMYTASGQYTPIVILKDALSNEEYIFGFEGVADSLLVDVINANEEDTSPPELLNFTMISLATATASTGITTVTFQVVVSDTLSGVQNGYVAITTLEMEEFNLREFISMAPMVGTQSFTVAFTFDKDFEWSEDLTLVVYLWDFVGNYVVFESSDLAALGFIAILPLIPG